MEVEAAPAPGAAATEDKKRTVPDLELAQWRFLLVTKDVEGDHAAVAAKFRDAIIRNCARRRYRPRQGFSDSLA